MIWYLWDNSQAFLGRADSEWQDTGNQSIDLETDIKGCWIGKLCNLFSYCNLFKLNFHTFIRNKIPHFNNACRKICIWKTSFNFIALSISSSYFYTNMVTWQASQGHRATRVSARLSQQKYLLSPKSCWTFFDGVGWKFDALSTNSLQGNGKRTWKVRHVYLYKIKGLFSNNKQSR